MILLILMIIVGVPLIVVLLTVFLPWVLTVDSESGMLFELTNRPVFISRGYLTKGKLEFRNVFLGIPFRFSTSDNKKVETVNEPTANKRKTANRKIAKRPNIHWIIRKAKAVIQSIKIKECILVLDTDDVLWNAWLYPIFFNLNRKNRKLRISYTGELRFRMVIEFLPVRTAWYFLTR